MAAEDELDVPEVPEAKPTDAEDVSWALSTAEAMWARGDHLEGIKWVRKAAEAAGDAENDERALELAKAASELTAQVARRSRASVDADAASGSATPSAGPAVTSKSTPPKPVARSAPPPLPAGKSAPPAVRPSMAVTNGAPTTPSSSAPKAPHPPRATYTPRATPEPPSIVTVRDSEDAASARGTTAERARRRDSLEVTAAGATVDVAMARPRLSGSVRLEPDVTVVTRVAGRTASERDKSTLEWDASPTLNLTGDEMDHGLATGDRATTAFALAAVPPSSPSSVAPLTAARPATTRAAAPSVHDPQIHTSQAVRVVVWRDASGVHIAPTGTVVSAITIDAVLVALEPSADLTAWLSKRER